MAKFFNGRVKVAFLYGQKTISKYEVGNWHPGIDLIALDDPSVFTPLPGKVIRATSESAGYKWGNYVVIEVSAATDYRMGIYLILAHLERFFVKAGEWVDVGDLIGIMGDSGNSNAPHLHVEIQTNYYAPLSTINPHTLFGIPYEEDYIMQPEPTLQELLAPLNTGIKELKAEIKNLRNSEFTLKLK